MEGISNLEIQEFLQKNFGESILSMEESFGLLAIEVHINHIYKVVSYLYKDETMKFQFLTDLCGVHYPDSTNRELGVVYHLQSMTLNKRLKLKVFVPVEKPEVPTLTGIYGSANWMERETFDFFGIRFLGHPNLKRILNMDEMVDFPMRKEFPLEDPTRDDKADFQFGR
ncbi:MAG: NADH-quinone oxidoreductase subunit C [Saprospiraceae bacterium]|nr:NADH-quinone oxidoreductase subunit C [Candidatus Defluviibacterium haderslevense]